MLGDDLPVEKEGWQVSDVKAALWAANKVKQAEDRINRRREAVLGAIEQFEKWEKKQNESDQSSIDFMLLKLRDYAEAELQAQKKRSLDLPGVRIGFRKLPDVIDITDEAKVIAENPDCVRIIPEQKHVDKIGLKEMIKQTGVIPDGVDWTPGGDRFYCDFE